MFGNSHMGVQDAMHKQNARKREDVRIARPSDAPGSRNPKVEVSGCRLYRIGVLQGPR